MKKQYFLLFTILGLMIFASAAVIHKASTNHNTSIKLSENNDAIYIIAEYPEVKSEKLGRYLVEQLGMTDKKDLSFVHIDDYIVPDGRMKFDIKTYPGYLKLSLLKQENSADAGKRFKEASKGIGELLKD